MQNENVTKAQLPDGLYDPDVWHVNTGGETIHAKRMPGRFRTLKWLAASVWIIFFLGPYLRWGGRQAVLLDIPDRKFYIFEATIMPQDVWMLSLVLLFFAILLAMVTSIASRVFCGFFCFQTVWTDVFTWIEEKLEGPPAKRRKLDQAPLSAQKAAIKGTKHALWIAIGALTGISFAAWFTDAPTLWRDLVTLQAAPVAYIVVAMFTAGTYLLAGFMREQVCFWLCPYARIQGVMYDKETVLPAYDFTRGEPRGKLKKGEVQSNQGHCIDCNQCVAVCPTGIDIRNGQQEGCITCALCIDACDAIMDKIGKPRGLIRYASHDELAGKPTKKIHQRPRVLVYAGIVAVAAVGIVYGLSTLTGLELTVLHERSPLFVQQSDGSIQNKYYLRVLNKTDEALQARITASGPEGMVVTGLEEEVTLRPSDVSRFTVFVRVQPAVLAAVSTPIEFAVHTVGDPELSDNYTSMFFAPAP